MIRKARNLPRPGDMTVFSDRQAQNGAMMRLARELIPYFGASAVGLAIDVSLLWLQVSVIGVPYLAAAAISFLTGTVLVYWASIRHIFGFRRLASARNEFVLFVAVGLVGLAWWFALIIGAVVVLRRLQAAEKRSPVLLLGATGTARSDHLIVIGVFTAMLVNSITTEGLGAGVNVSAIWLFVVCAWLTILDRDQRAVRSARQRELTGKVRDRQLEALA